MKMIAVLFVDRDSVYKTLPECDCYDEDRDARSYLGGLPVVAHPPCRLWGVLAHMSTAPPEEKELAIWAVDQVRKWGGVLEHPKGSRLWAHCGLPRPWNGNRDEFGGFTLDVNQHWWGHRAQKRTLLYVVGCKPSEVPPFPLVLGKAEWVVNRSRGQTKKHISKRERSATPPDFARWLVDLAGKCGSGVC